ncbi:MAG TPA: hypothetical protein VFC56_07490 [Stellaceae bacterium]|nr:hypothetical protein [Stellaceae bacterium]
MTIFVAEIQGRGIAAFDADTKADAQQMVEADWFTEDLMVLQSEGKPLWDGSAEIFIREAIDDEGERWDAARRRSGEDEDYLLFLLPVTDPTDDVFDEDGP